MNRKLSTFIERVNSDEEILARIYPDTQNRNASNRPNWIYPFEYGYLLLKEVDCGDFFVRKAQQVAELVEIMQQYEQKAPISFKDINGKKSHSHVCYYGSERKCHEVMEEIKKDLSEILHSSNARKIKKEDQSSENSSPVEIVDLTKSSFVKKSGDNANKEIPGRTTSILPSSEKIDYIYKSIKVIAQDIISFRGQLTDLTNSQATLLEILTRDNTIVEDTTEKKISPERFQKPDKLVEAELTAKFIELLVKKRGSREWCKQIKSMSIPGVNSEQNKNIKELLLYGSTTVGSFMRSLAKELFGEERLLTTILGDHGEFLKGVKQQDRAYIFSCEDELLLLKILKLIDAEFFTSKDVYKFLVREKINSYGRDLKKAPQSKQANSSTKARSYNITSFFKKIIKPDPDNNKKTENQHLDERTYCDPTPGPSGLRANFKGKESLVNYDFSSQSSNDE